MFAALARSVPKARLVGQVRHVISGPPMTRMTLAEQVSFGVIMTAGYCFVPGWILYHVKEYRGAD